MKDSILFGVTVSILAYWIGYLIKKKLKSSLLNPLLISMLLIIVFLKVCNINYEVYNYGAKYISFFITPATVCLAIPLYKQVEVLRKNIAAIVVSIFCGVVAHIGTIIGLAYFLHVDLSVVKSLIPKSITMAFAIPVTEELGGISAITIVGLTIAGLLGAVAGPAVMKLFRITEPMAQGLGIGSSSHAVGTSRAIELGEVAAAMSSIAIAVTGFMTVLIAPFAENIWFLW